MGFIKVTKEVLEDEYKELIHNYNTDVEVKKAIDLFNLECESRATKKKQMKVPGTHPGNKKTH